MTGIGVRVLVGVGALAALAGCGNSATSDNTQRDESGEVTSGGEVGVFRLQVGDCVAETDIDADDVFDSLPVVPCSEPHQLEVYHAFDLADGDYPGDSEVFEQAAEGCLAAFRGFVGVDFSQSVYDVTPIRPTAESWAEIDDREVLCALFEGEGILRTGSAEGSTR